MLDDHDHWYALRNRQPIGPVVRTELLGMIERGVLTQFDSIRRHDIDDWTLVRDADLTQPDGRRKPLSPPQQSSPQQSSPQQSPPQQSSPQQSVKPRVALTGTSAQSLRQRAHEELDVEPIHDSAAPSPAAVDGEMASHAADAILRKMRTTSTGGALTRRAWYMGHGFLSLPLAWLISLIDAISNAIGFLLGNKTLRLVVMCVAFCGTAWGAWLKVDQHLPVPPDLVLADFQSLFEQVASLPQDADDATREKLQRTGQSRLHRWHAKLNLQASFRQPALLELRTVAELLPELLDRLDGPLAEDDVLVQKIGWHLSTAQDKNQRRIELGVIHTNGAAVLNDLSFWGLLVVNLMIAAWLIRSLAS